jgi:diphthine synthase
VALWLIGLGLHDVRGMTVAGREAAGRCATLYAEFYTAILATPHPEIEAFLGKPVRKLDRLGVEKGADRLLAEAKQSDVGLLVAGDPMAATTHADLLVRAGAAGVAVHVVHAPSILSAAPGLLGLQHYKFGRTTTLVRPQGSWNPTSPFDAVAENHARGLHTLVLLDIQADTGYFMRGDEGVRQLLDLAKRTGASWFDEQTPVAVVARAGSESPGRWTGPAGRLAKLDFGAPLHCIVVPGPLHDVEAAAWALWATGAGPTA